MSKHSSSQGHLEPVPTTPTVGSDYQLHGTGLPVDMAVSVYVTDPKGSQWTDGHTGLDGTLTITQRAPYPGLYTARVTTGAVKATTLASCEFTVT